MNKIDEQTWGVRMLQRNISSLFYQLTLMSQHKDMIKQEMLEITGIYNDAERKS